MKRLLYLLSLMALLTLSTGCTHNNGDIGDWFGTWKLQTIEIDGTVDADYPDNVLWKFQNNIISMVQAYDELHTSDCRYGTWSELDGQLLLDFGHSDDTYGPGQGQYQPLPCVYIPAGNSVLTIVKLTGSELILRYTSDNNTHYTYYFTKWG